MPLFLVIIVALLVIGVGIGAVALVNGSRQPRKPSFPPAPGGTRR